MRVVVHHSGAGASLRPVYVTAGLVSTAAVAYGVAGVEPSPVVSLGFSLAPLGAGVAWVRRDALTHREWLAHDWGFLTLALWPFSLIGYVLHTRGWRGLGLLGCLVGVVFLPWLVWAVASVVQLAVRG